MKQLIYLLVVLVLGITACTSNNETHEPKASPTSPPLAQVLEDGEANYLTYCAVCHGTNGEGQNPEDPTVPDENGRYLAPPHDETGHTMLHADDELIMIISEGGMGDPIFFNEMPAFGEILSNYQIEAILTYIKTFWTEQQRIEQKDRTEFEHRER